MSAPASPPRAASALDVAAPPKVPLEPDSLLCFVCGEQANPNARWRCDRAGKVAHALCATCLREYVSHCLRDYAQGTLPLKCPFSHCRAPIPEHALTRLLGADATVTHCGRQEPLLPLLERLQLQAALLPLDPLTEVCVTCPGCELYVEIFSRPAALRGAHVRRAVDEARESGHAASAEAAAPAPAARVEPAGAALSVNFFRCRRHECGVAVCLACRVQLPRGAPDAEHKCGERAMEVLHREIVELLAREATQRCPRCNSAWHKDLACTHMTCAKCNVRWCYACGRSEATIGGFAEHGQWDLGAPEGRCPTYLQYLYGELQQPDQARRDGDPARALRLFHVDKQETALAQLRASVLDDALFDATLARFFPGGVFDRADLEAVEAARARRAQARAERAEQRRREEARRARDHFREAAAAELARLAAAVGHERRENVDLRARLLASIRERNHAPAAVAAAAAAAPVPQQLPQQQQPPQQQPQAIRPFRSGWQVSAPLPAPAPVPVARVPARAPVGGAEAPALYASLAAALAARRRRISAEEDAANA